MVAFFEGHADWEETVRTLKRDTRRYAKRQMTWFKADPDMMWISPEDIRQAEQAIGRFWA
jgi:tRNA dimethylallyltransferase